MSGLDYSPIAAHKTCTDNRQALSKAGKGACFYCLEEFAAGEISEWVDRDTTALCPRCGIDSVLSVTGQTADKEFLRQMHDYWFERTVRL